MIWLLRRCIGVSGLQGIEKLLSFMIIYEMKSLIKFFKRDFSPEAKKTMQEIYQSVKNVNQLVDNYQKIYINSRKQ